MAERRKEPELTWIGKGERPTLGPHDLVESAELSYEAKPSDQGGTSDNRLIRGDNLLALKALGTEFAGTIKCAYLDPPYNTGVEFAHYNNRTEHSRKSNAKRPPGRSRRGSGGCGFACGAEIRFPAREATMEFHGCWGCCPSRVEKPIGTIEVMHTTRPGSRRAKKRASRQAAAEASPKKPKKTSRAVRSTRGR